ncbi:hypothetical protein D0Y65_001352 [Glycine soja]|uniref:Uncharacterized protein n=1 Tax=Glycine soja TaxID=3848 RepID=A0A445M2K9_GLYSO|nr:hypothetical protein D0Y65_001352 [Glycine soja]
MGWNGIIPTYTKWTWHGELPDNPSVSHTKSVKADRGCRIEDMIRDLGQDGFQEAHAPLYEKMENDSKIPLYSGCTTFTRLSTVLALKLLPEDNMLPKNQYEAKKILYPVGMEYQKIHACPNDCILYRNEFAETSDVVTAENNRPTKVEKLMDCYDIPLIVRNGRHSILCILMNRLLLVRHPLLALSKLPPLSPFSQTYYYSYTPTRINSQIYKIKDPPRTSATFCSTNKELSSKKCVPCNTKDLQLMTEDAARTLLPQGFDWHKKEAAFHLQVQKLTEEDYQQRVNQTQIGEVSMGVTQEKGRVAHIADLLANFCLSVSWQTQSLKLLHRLLPKDWNF